MADWLLRLQSSLRAHQARPITWKTPHGELLLTVHAARVLGCAMPKVEGNMFFHRPQLEDPDTAGPVLAGGGGLGGDRLWVAPEAGFIFTDVKKARKNPQAYAKLPPAMDPAAWRVMEESDGHLRLATDMRLHDHRTGKNIQLRVSRQFNLAAAPAELPGKLSTLSFTVRNELALLQGDAGAVAGAWDLLQLPPTGWLICPTVTPAKKHITSYYDPFGPKHLRCDSTSVRFLIDAQRRVKMGFPALYSTGRLGYYRKVGKVSTLIVRCFAPMPGDTYVDVPLSSDGFIGQDCVQAYNDDGSFAPFGELEYHDPGLVVGKPPTSRVGTTITHVMSGSDADIKKAGRLLLGVAL